MIIEICKAEFNEDRIVDFINTLAAYRLSSKRSHCRSEQTIMYTREKTEITFWTFYMVIDLANHYSRTMCINNTAGAKVLSDNIFSSVYNMFGLSDRMSHYEQNVQSERITGRIFVPIRTSASAKVYFIQSTTIKGKQ